MDCPLHTSARKPAPNSKIIEDIVKDGRNVAMMRVVKDMLVTLEPSMEGNLRVLGREKGF